MNDVFNLCLGLAHELGVSEGEKASGSTLERVWLALGVNQHPQSDCSKFFVLINHNRRVELN